MPTNVRNCIAAAIMAASLAAACPQLHATETGRAPEVPAFTDHQPPQVPTDEGAPSAPRPTRPVDDDTGRVFRDATIYTVVTVIIGGAICIASGGTLCLFTIPGL